MSLERFLKEEATRLNDPESLRERSEWVEAVARLMERMRTWLGEADTEHVLDVKDEAHVLSEEGFGAYEVRGLVVRLGRRTVRAVPVAGRVAGPLRGAGSIAAIEVDGRVDLVGDGMRYFLYRGAAGGPEERWSIVEEDSVVVRPFDRPAFEHAFERLLR